MAKDEYEEEHPKLNKYALGCSIVVSMISVIFGYDTGVMSGALVYIEVEMNINDVQVEVLAGMLNLCALVGSLIAGKTSDTIGRRYTLVVGSIIFVFGSIIMGYSPNYGVLLTGRCVAGVGVGFALMLSPVYTSEISPAKTRGFLSSLPDIAISFGIFLGYVANYAFSNLSLKVGWRIMLAAAGLPSIFLAIGILKMPESPRWLVMQGRLGEAKEIFAKVSNSKDEAEARFRDLKVAAGIDENCTDDIVKVPKNSNGKGVWKELILRPTPSVRWILIAAIGLHFFNHATGIEAVLLYSPRILKKAGLVDRKKRLLATIGVGFMKTVFIFVSTYFLDRIGRRPILLASTVGMTLCLTTLGTALTIVEHAKERVNWALYLSMVSIYSFIACFSMGMGPIAWVYLSEIFPLRLRAQGVSIGVAVNRVMNATVSMTFLSIAKKLTTGGTFFLFAGMGVLSLFFFYFFLPETMGKSLEEVESLFGKTTRSGDEELVSLHPSPNQSDKCTV